MLEGFVRAVNNVQRGLKLSQNGFVASITRGKIQRYFYKSFLFLVVSILVLHLLAAILIYLPLTIIKTILFLLSFVTDLEHSKTEAWTDYFMNLVLTGIWSMPFNTLFLIRYVYPYPMNNIFLVSLESLNPKFHEVLLKVDYQLDYWSELRYSFKRFSQRMTNYLLIYLFSLLPMVGQLAIPLASFLFCYKIVGIKLAVSLATINLLIPSFKPTTILLLRTILDCRALGRELLEPYFNRMGFGYKERRKFFKGKGWLLFGFTLAYYLAISIPVVGPVFYVIAQSAITTFLVETTEPPQLPVTEKRE